MRELREREGAGAGAGARALNLHTPSCSLSLLSSHATRARALSLSLPFSLCLSPPFQVNKGVYVMFSGLDYERLVLAGGPLGLAAAALDVAVPYAAQRVQGGKIIGEHQLVGGRLADMHVRTAASRALVLEAAERADGAGWATPGERAAACAGAILFAAEAATQTALDALQVLGGNGYINDYPTGRLLRDAKLYEIGAGTSEIRRLVVARALVGAHKGAK